MPSAAWDVQREVCLAFLHERAGSILEKHEVSDADALCTKLGVSNVDKALYQRMADDLLTAIIRRHSPAQRYFAAPIRNPVELGMLIAFVLVIGACIGAAWLYGKIDLDDPGSYPILSGFVGFCAVVAAALGWGFTGWVAHRNNRAKHTLDVVAARFAQPAFGQALASFNVGFAGKRIDKALIADYSVSKNEQDRDALQGLRYLVNYFEFIAVGVLEGELDDRIVRKTLRGNLIYVYDRCAIYIGEVQRDNPRTLEHFTLLRAHYRSL